MPKMIGNTFYPLCTAIALAFATSACAPKASEEEIDDMCAHLLELRGKTGDEAMKVKCKADAQKEGVTQKQARCRISAANTQEYWNRCRTGEARGR